MKKVCFVLVLAMVIAGGVFAQSFGAIGTNSRIMAPAFSGTSVLSGSLPLNLDLLAEEGTKKPFGGSACFAGLLNIPLGLWSWINKDWLGGGITAGLAVGGIVIINISGKNTDGGITGLGWLGMGMFIASPIYGYKRGSSQYKKMTEGLASANPLDHLTVLPVATSKDDVGLALTYSVNF
jgi:hypothetical protein